MIRLVVLTETNAEEVEESVRRFFCFDEPEMAGRGELRSLANGEYESLVGASDGSRVRQCAGPNGSFCFEQVDGEDRSLILVLVHDDTDDEDALDDVALEIDKLGKSVYGSEW